MANEWKCPYCNIAQIVTDNSSSADGRFWHGKSATKVYGYRIDTILCANPDCKQISVAASVGEAILNSNSQFIRVNPNENLFFQRLLPQGNAKPQPSFLPKAIVEDYTEACLVRDLSPKASATLIRRCLQGMIRDFAGISKPTLAKEIEALRSSVADGTADRAITTESVEAIDQVRGIGNIGAHMEKDIDLIVPVDPGEAQALIELVEMLFEEWYVARETRKSRLSRIAEIASDKKSIKAEAAESGGSNSK